MADSVKEAMNAIGYVASLLEQNVPIASAAHHFLELADAACL